MEGQVPVIMKIHFRGKSGLFELTNKFTAYPNEGEVLLQDGLEYQVISNDEMKTKDTNECF